MHVAWKKNKSTVRNSNSRRFALECRIEAISPARSLETTSCPLCPQNARSTQVLVYAKQETFDIISRTMYTPHSVSPFRGGKEQIVACFVERGEGIGRVAHWQSRSCLTDELDLFVLVAQGEQSICGLSLDPGVLTRRLHGKPH